jgi:hypothetical protein
MLQPEYYILGHNELDTLYMKIHIDNFRRIMRVCGYH